MNNFNKRIITGTLIVLVMTISVCWNGYSFIFLMTIINVFALLEFYDLFHSDEILPRKIAGAILSVFFLIAMSLFAIGKSDWKVLLFSIPFTFLIFILELYQKAQNPFHNLAFTFLGILYITIPLSLFILIPFLNPFRIYHFQIILGYLFILWANDTSAYLTGKIFGNHPLFKRISPGKTWEGSIGGFIGALWVTYAISLYFSILNLNDWLIIAFIIVVVGTYGDLVKSMMKRSLNIKDTGNILPGHGGVLDRFDSLLSSAPFVFLYLMLW